MGNQGDTELFDAVYAGDLEKVKQLINRANLNAVDSERNTPLMVAVMRRYRDIAEFFLLRKAALNMESEFGGTALHFACEGGDPYIVKLLIIAGADLNSHQAELGAPPILFAADNEILKLLIEHGADINGSSDFGITALINAAESGNYIRVKLLLEYGANMFVRDFWGRTASIAARENGYDDLAQLIEQYQDQKHADRKRQRTAKLYFQ